MQPCIAIFGSSMFVYFTTYFQEQAKVIFRDYFKNRLKKSSVWSVISVFYLKKINKIDIFLPCVKITYAIFALCDSNPVLTESRPVTLPLCHSCNPKITPRNSCISAYVTTNGTHFHFCLWRFGRAGLLEQWMH